MRTHASTEIVSPHHNFPVARDYAGIRLDASPATVEGAPVLRFAVHLHDGITRWLNLSPGQIVELLDARIPGLKVEYTEPPKPLPQHLGAVVVIPAFDTRYSPVYLTRFRRTEEQPTRQGWISPDGLTYTDEQVQGLADARKVPWRPALPSEMAPLVEEAVTE